MAIAESLTRLAATLISLTQTRLELIAVELEEESLRLFSYLFFGLAAMFCLGITILLGIFLIVVLYWDTHRVGVMVSLMIFFGVTSMLLALSLHRRYRQKPKLLAHTLAEFSRDFEKLHPPE